jgi:replicative DNA helicase
MAALNPSVNMTHLTLDHHLREYFGKLDSIYCGEAVPASISTSFDDLDWTLGGGLARGALTIVAGRPGTGKTLFSLQVAEQAARQACGVLFFSPLQSSSQIVNMLLACHSGRPILNWLNGRLGNPDWKSLTGAVGAIDAIRQSILIDDAPNPTIDQFRQTVTAATEFFQGHTRPSLGLVVVDSIHDMTEPTSINQWEGATIPKQLAAIARKHGVALLAAADVHPRVDRRQNRHPHVVDILGASAVEHASAAILMLYREVMSDAHSKQSDLLECSVVRNRYGPCRTIRMSLDERPLRIQPG